MSVKIGFWILYFNPNSTFVKGGVGILKAFMTWVVFFLLLRFEMDTVMQKSWEDLPL